MNAKRFIATLLMLLACAWAHAQVAGTVQFVAGQVQLERGGTRTALAVSSPVNVGDVVVTGADGLVQLVMVDAGRISMRPGTRLRIDDYRYDPANPGASGALLTLVQGMLRSFTGEIVGSRKRDYRIKTPIASVGVRGSGNILAHDDTLGTINHTLTGAHSVTSVVNGLERTLVSYPGQTIQVRPGQPPRFIPTPPLLFSTAASGTPGGAATDGGSAPASADPALATGTGGVAAASTASTQATTATAAAALAAFQPTPGLEYQVGARFAVPYAGGGFEGVVSGTSSPDGGILTFDSSGRLVRMTHMDYSTFLPGPGAPSTYVPTNVVGTGTFVGGQFFDGFRADDGSVALGRWQGGDFVITPDNGGAPVVIALGSRSIPYAIFAATPPATLGAFTGLATYTLVAATAPSDAAGRTGTVSSATVQANFGNLAVNGAMAFSVNGASYGLSGSSAMTRGNGNFAFATGLGTLAVTCTGNCATTGYQGTWTGNFAGRTAEWLAMTYRINPVAVPGNALSDFITGALALRSATTPGLALPAQLDKAQNVFVRPALAVSRAMPRQPLTR